MPGWEMVSWKANGGYGNQGQGRGRANAKRECLWLSPACQAHQAQQKLFDLNVPDQATVVGRGV